MIEVEIKVTVTEEQKQKLLENATFISEEMYTITYYDSDDFALTSKGFWLRKRDGRFELKTPATPTGTFDVNKNIPMHEFTDLDEIAQKIYLDKSYKSSFENALNWANYKPLYHFKNTRQTYKKNSITIDFDRADFGDLIYEVCELEIMVENKEQCPIALEKLYAFAKEFGISTEKAEGKLGFYIKRRNKKHAEILEKLSR